MFSRSSLVISDEFTEMLGVGRELVQVKTYRIELAHYAL
jgi:hypothetical protein